jgi:hypothetical protein
MEKGLTKAFHKAIYKGDTTLAEDIWRSILVRNQHIARIKLWSFSFLGFASFVGFIPVFKTLSNSLAQSGLYEYFSLIFSNGSSVLSYWKELLFSIAESIPTMSIVLSLSFVFVFFLSLKYVMRQIIKGQSYSAEFLTLSF